MANINKRMKQNVERGKLAKAEELAALESQKKAENKKYWTRYYIMMIVYAAVYFAITFFTRDFAYGMHQFRIADAMIAIVLFDPAAFPGITIGCLVSNLLGPGFIIDVIMGTSATAFGIYMLRWWSEKNGKPYIGMALYAFFNAFMVAMEINYTGSLQNGLLEILAWVMLGEVVCSVLGGTILYFIISRRWKDIVSETKKGQKQEYTPTTLQ